MTRGTQVLSGPFQDLASLDSPLAVLSGPFQDLASLDSPLAVLSVLLAVLVFLVKSLVVPAWRLSKHYEQKLLSRLASALTYDRFREVIGAEPNAYRDLSLRSAQDPGHLGKLFILSRSYVEVFLDDENRVRAYTVYLRRGRLTLDVAGRKVKLGKTSHAEIMHGYMFAIIGYRSGRGFFELSGPWGVLAGRSWAWGDAPLGGRPGLIVEWLPYPLAWLWYWFKWRSLRRVRKLRQRFSRSSLSATSGPGRVHLLNCFSRAEEGVWLDLGSFDIDKEAFEKLRSRVKVTCVAASSSGDIQPYMLNLHEWEAAAADPLSKAQRALSSVLGRLNKPRAR
jgi:hypothetical protein